MTQINPNQINPGAATDKQVIAFDQPSGEFTIQDQIGWNWGAMNSYIIEDQTMDGLTPVTIVDSRITDVTPYNVYFETAPAGTITKTLTNGQLELVSDYAGDTMDFRVIFFDIGPGKQYLLANTTLTWAGPWVISDFRITATTPANVYPRTAPVGNITAATSAGELTISSTGTEAWVVVDYIIFFDSDALSDGMPYNATLADDDVFFRKWDGSWVDEAVKFSDMKSQIIAWVTPWPWTWSFVVPWAWQSFHCFSLITYPWSILWTDVWLIPWRYTSSNIILLANPTWEHYNSWNKQEILWWWSPWQRPVLVNWILYGILSDWYMSKIDVTNDISVIWNWTQLFDCSAITWVFRWYNWTNLVFWEYSTGKITEYNESGTLIQTTTIAWTTIWDSILVGNSNEFLFYDTSTYILYSGTYWSAVLTTLSYRSNNDPLTFWMERWGLIYFRSHDSDDETYTPVYKLLPR